MDDLDKFFAQMSELLNAAWPEIRKIDWSDYCTCNHQPESGVKPWYTGVLLYGNDGHGRERYEEIGEINDLEDDLQIVRNKAEVIYDDPLVFSSLQKRDPDKDIWAGGIRCSGASNIVFCITELPDLGDHLLLAHMLFKADLLRLSQSMRLKHFSYYGNMVEARDYLGISINQYNALDRHLGKLIWKTKSHL
jgi:hypothetical protein